MLRVNYENHKDLVSYGVKTVSESPALKDCLVLCSDGEKEVNSLILGLLFPVLGKCEVFHFPVSQTVFLQGVKIGELENMIKKLENSLSRVKHEPDEDEYIEEVDLQEAIPVVVQNDQVNQELAHIFGAEILSTFTLDNQIAVEVQDDPDDPQQVESEEIPGPQEKKNQSCPVENCSKKFHLDKLLKLHIKNAHFSPVNYIHKTPTKQVQSPSFKSATPSPSKPSSLTASPTSSPLKFYSPIKKVIPVQTLFKCAFQGCGKTFQKQQTFLKHKGSHKTKLELSTKENISKEERTVQRSRPQVLNKDVPMQMPVAVVTEAADIDLDQFYQENDILGEQFAYKSDKNQFKCLFDKCRTEFTYRHDLRSHYIDHDINEFMCPECDIQFDIKTSLNEHRFKAHHILTVNKDMCPFCDALFFTKESFRNHVLAKHRGPWKCDSCDEKFFTMNEFKQHRLDHIDTNLTCDWPNCNIIFSSRDLLKAHLSTHETEEFYTCPKYLCNFFFCTIQGFERHLKVHENEDSFDCLKCNKKYYNMRQFECHIEAGHMQNPKAYEFASEVNLDCPVENCKRSFVQEKWLLKHFKTHLQTENGSSQKSRRSRNTAVKVIKVQKTGSKPVNILEADQTNYQLNDANSVFFQMESA